MTYKIEDIQPLHDFAVLREFIAEDESMLTLPKGSAAEKRDMLYEVIAHGPGQLLPDGIRSPMLVKPGDIVVCANTANGAVLVRDDGNLYVCSQEHIVAKVGRVETMRRKVTRFVDLSRLAQ